MCHDAELILGYVYGDLPDSDRRAFDAHIAVCATCRNEVAELQATRRHLAAWTPPEPDLAFRIVRGQESPAPPRRWWFAPSWGLAAAAVLVLAAAAAIANVEMRYDANGLVVRTGWAREAGPAAGTSTGSIGQVAAAPDGWRSEMAALQARLRQLEDDAASRGASGETRPASGPRMSDAEMLRRVREVVGQSETRQQREFALQIAQVLRDVDRARQLDFIRIQQGFGQHRAQTSAEVAQTVNYLLTRASQQK